MRERRRAPRQKFSGTGLAVTPSMSARCVIEDLSASGARLTFSYAAVLPWNFVLRFDDDEREERVQMVWRNGAVVGVSFRLPIQMPAARSAAAVHADGR